MKKPIYILIIVFLTYGKGFAGSDDVFNSDLLDSTEKMFSQHLHVNTSNNGELLLNGINLENDFCENPSERCLDYTFPMNSKSKDHTNCAKAFSANEGMKTYGITTIYFTSIDAYKTTNTLKFVEAADPSYLGPINSKFKRLQNVDLDEYFFEPLNPVIIKGFGIRLKI